VEGLDVDRYVGIVDVGCRGVRFEECWCSCTQVVEVGEGCSEHSMRYVEVVLGVEGSVGCGKERGGLGSGLRRCREGEQVEGVALC
jgi:hypothetical protein